jgi:hypothetical protein
VGSFVVVTSSIATHSATSQAFMGLFLGSTPLKQAEHRFLFGSLQYPESV